MVRKSELIMEQWRDIKGYENLYQISNLGRVKSLSNNKTKKEKIIKPGITRDGYLYVILSKEGKTKGYRLHRLVALAFIDNPDNLPVVNHINEDKTDNSVDNLEWCTSEYNSNYGTHNERVATALSIPIYSINITTNEITYYKSINDAGRLTNINQGNICSCLKGKRKSTGGRYWYYAS